MKPVKVTLVVTQRVTYRREFDMDADSFAEVQRKLETLRGLELSLFEERFAETHIDFSDDWYDADDTEIIEFEEAKE